MLEFLIEYSLCGLFYSTLTMVYLKIQGVTDVEIDIFTVSVLWPVLLCRLIDRLYMKFVHGVDLDDEEEEEMSEGDNTPSDSELN